MRYGNEKSETGRPSSSVEEQEESDNQMDGAETTKTERLVAEC